MSKWSESGVPHKGWTLIGCYDNGANNENENWETCEMCSNEKVRYVHTVYRDDYGSMLVGRVCAEKMTEDYVNPRRKEADLRNRSRRRSNWTSREWKKTKNGYKIKKGDFTVLVFACGDKWKVMISRYGQKIWGKKFHPTVDAAKLAAFDYVESQQEEG